MKSILRVMDGPTIACLVLVALASAASLSAQDSPEAVNDEPVAEELWVKGMSSDDGQSGEAAIEPGICEASGPRTVTLAKMTPVYLSIDATLGSKISTSGEFFPITVTEPVMMGDEVIIPVGAQGQGEVIHAKKAGASGSGGELILTANYVEIEGQQVPLRSMKIGLTGKDQTGLALATGVFTGPIGFLVRGKNIDVAEGTLAGAKLSQDTEIFVAAEEASGGPNCFVEAEGIERDAQ